MKRVLVSLLLVAAVLAVGRTGDGGARPILPEAGMAKKRSVEPGVQGFDKQHGPHSQFECIATSGGANTNLDCDDPFPNNEPDIEVDPANPQHVIASSNDYGSCCDQMYTTFDNGATWLDGGHLPEEPAGHRQRSGDRHSTAGTAPRSTRRSTTRSRTRRARSCRGDLVVSVSTDGGVVWQPPTVVASGLGCDLSNVQYFNDKEWIVTDNNPSSPFYGRTYLTWTRFDAAFGELHALGDLRGALGRRRQALDRPSGDLRVERRACARSR